MAAEKKLGEISHLVDMTSLHWDPTDVGLWMFLLRNKHRIAQIGCEHRGLIIVGVEV